MPPVDDQLRMAPPPVGSIVRRPCLVPSITPVRFTAMNRSYSSTVGSASGECAPMPATLRTASTWPNSLTAAANIASTEASSVTSTWNGADGVTERGGGVVLPAADVGGQHLGPFPDEHLGGGPSHAGTGAGDDGDLSLELCHAAPRYQSLNGR